jgi:hypothetical protein
MRRCWLKVAFLLLPFWIHTAAAQQSPGVSDSDREIIRQLVERVQQLEAEVKELKAQRAIPASAAMDSPPPASLAQTQTTPPPQIPATGNKAPMDMPDAASHGSPTMTFRGYSDVYYRATDQKGTTNSFALGQFNLFITSKLSDHIGVLAEAVLEADQNNAFGFELERLQLEYSANDYFNVNFGRYHTAIGWYNTAYHHSTWMQTAVGRPFLFEFEDKGGILPIHNVGISANGRIPSGTLGLRYVAEIGNGRSSRSPLDEPVQNIVDENNGKAVNFALIARPDSLPGFQGGFSIYHDRLYPEGSSGTSETIMAAHAVYQSPSFEWLNEAMLIRHAEIGADQVANTSAFYSQISRKFGVVRPYFRYQYVNAPTRDPIFPDVQLLYGPSVGLRFDFSEFAAFKIQYDRTDTRHQGGINGITTQLSFAF